MAGAPQPLLSSREDAFRKALADLQDELDADAVSALTTLIPKLSTAQRTSKTAKELLLTLEKQSRLGEENVQDLIKWLHDVNLNKAAEILENYQDEFSQPSNSGTLTLEDTSNMCQSHSSTSGSFIVEYVCLTCHEPVCAKCLAEEHKSHERLRMEDIRRVVTDQLKCVDEESAGVGHEEYFNTLKEKVQTCFQNEVHRMSDEMFSLTNAIDEERNKETVAAMVGSNDMKQRAIDLRARLSDIVGGPMVPRDKWPQLQALINDADSLVEESQLTTSTRSNTAERLLFVKGSKREANLGVLIYGSLAGANWIKKDPSQVCRIFDERMQKGRISLVCSDKKDPGKIYWDYSIKESSTTPLIVSHRSILVDAHNQLLLATGQAVFFVRLSTAELADLKTSCNGVRQVYPFQLECPREDAWVTAMSVHRPSGDDPCGEFIVAFNGCTTLYEYTVSHVQVGETRTPLRSFDCSSSIGINGNIVGVAYKQTHIALIDSSDDQTVKVLEHDGNADGGDNSSVPAKEVFQLRDTRGDMFVKIVYATSAKWMILWQSRSPPYKYSVFVHKIKSKSTGVLCVDGERQVHCLAGVCRFGTNALLCFSNGEWKEFLLRE